MKSNKVLLGLFAGVMALVGGAAHAQVDTNFYEIGPSNIGGCVSSLVVDMNDASGTTIYAGAISGGLFVRSGNEDVLTNLYTALGRDVVLAANQEIWHYVPYTEGGIEVALPINSMAQAYDGTILIGTGDDRYQIGSTNSPMSTLGRGIYRFNPSTFQYSVVPDTKPAACGDRFAAVHDIDVISYDGKAYVYAVTGTGLYRWVVNGQLSDDSQWGNCETVFEGDVDQMLIISSLRVAYFTVGNQLYMISNVCSPSTPFCANVSSSNAAFGGENTAIKLAVAPSDPSYLYAMVIDANGMMENIYLTRNMQTWYALATNTVTPFTKYYLNGTAIPICDGRNTGFVQVDPGNPKRIFIGGSSIWTGEGFVENSYYQWTKVSLSEAELNYGNYMSTVFGSYSFVHSGINQILPVYREEDGNGYYEYFIATDGGVYTTHNGFHYFQNINRGLNNVQINSVAVCPDASVISGAHNNACPMIESRTEHHGGDVNVTWFDNGTLGNMNHDANVLWTSEGGQVAASMFQELQPQSRRGIFVSSNNAFYGRSYADYLDYTNTQTWTSGKDFSSNRPYIGSEIGRFYLWETYNDTVFNDSLTVHIDTLGYVMRPDTTTGGYDSTYIGSSNFMIKSGDKLTVTSKANSDYPFEYTFTQDQQASESLRVKNPIQARAMLIATDTSGDGNMWTVYMSWRATDYTKVWDRSVQGLPGDDWSTLNLWAGIYVVNTIDSLWQPRAVTLNSDGRAAYIAVQNQTEGKSMLVRVRGFENVDFSAPTKTIYATIRCRYLSSLTALTTDTLAVSDTSIFFPRVISSIMVDTVGGDERLILTFEGYNENYANVAFVNDILDNWSLQTSTITNKKGLPAFCSMVDKTTGDLYIGTSDGVWVKSGNSWHQYEHLNGLAVTSMVQQQADLPVRRHLTHNGITPEKRVYAKTKWPNAMYFGTYGRGIFMDMSKVTDRSNEVSDPDDYNNVGIPTVVNTAAASVSVFPNPVSGDAHLSIGTAEAGTAQLRIYDLNGRCVMDRQLGSIAEGEHVFTIGTEGMAKGMYLINVIIGGHTATAKMMVR